MARLNTPNALLQQRGSRRVRDEVEVETGAARPTFTLSPEGQRAWDRLSAEMEKIGILSPAYSDFMTIAADAIGDIEIASRDLAERGHISITERGETKNPSFTIKTSASATAHKYLIAIGLTPTTIGKLTGAKKEEANPFADL